MKGGVKERKLHESSGSHFPLFRNSGLLNLGKLACCVLQNKWGGCLRQSIDFILWMLLLAMFWWQGKVRHGCGPSSMPCISWLVRGEKPTCYRTSSTLWEVLHSGRTLELRLSLSLCCWSESPKLLSFLSGLVSVMPLAFLGTIFSLLVA